MGRLFSGLKRGLWLSVVAGIIFSLGSWAWGVLDGFLGLFGISKWIALVILPAILTIIGIVSESALIPRLSAWFQSWATSSMMRRFARNEDVSDDPDSWSGKEVAVAVGEGCYHGGNIPAMQKFGIVTATFVENGIHFVSVQFIYPPTGTGEVLVVRQDSCRIRLTGRSSVDHMATVSSLGRVRRKVALPPTPQMIPHSREYFSENKKATSLKCVKAPAPEMPCGSEDPLAQGLKFLKMDKL